MTASETLSTNERELATEQAHVDLVYRRLGEAAASARRVAAEGQAIYRSDRQTFLREEDGTAALERDVFAYQAAKRLATLDAEHEGLVFGRLDHTDGEVRYIGRIGVRDADYEPLVIDWRARAAEPFYRATPAEPMTVVRRRVLRCRGDKVIDISDDLLDGDSATEELVVIGEGALMAALSRARGHSMRDIVATIQAEQDEAIRAPWAGFTLISGGPGTGKTVVALHRAAYLLYSNRRRFENGGVLVVGPSRVFMNYIERVLPSLGEDAVTLRAIGSVAADVVAVRGERVDEPLAATVKGSLRMVRVLRRLVDEPLGGNSLELRVSIKGEALILRAPQLARVRADVLRQHKVNVGRPIAEAALLGALWVRWRELTSPGGTSATLFGPDADTDPLDRDAFDDLVTSTAQWQMFGNAWWPTLSATALLVRLADPGIVGRVADGMLEDDEQRALQSSYANLPTGAGGRPDWSIADSALLDELVDLIGPAVVDDTEEASVFLENGAGVEELVTTADRLAAVVETDPFAEQYETYAHILVDEAQDITPMQWRMLRRRGSNASWTIVGDPAQSSWPDEAESQRALDSLMGSGRPGSAPVRRFRMSTNYRSPAEVFTFASQVVAAAYPRADLPTAVRSTGIDPMLVVVEDSPLAPLERLRELVLELADQVEGTVGVIVAPSLIDEVAQALADERMAPVAARLALVTPLQSKGLEYDGVLVVSPDRVVAESSGGIRTLYVALTRPTQRLVTLDWVGDHADWRADLR